MFVEVMCSLMNLSESASRGSRGRATMKCGLTAPLYREDDVTNASSFQACAKWVAKCRAVASAGSEQRASSKTGSGSGGAVTGGLDSSELGVLVANKIDLADGGGRRAVSEKEGQRFARANNLVYFETSAKANTGVDAPFTELAKLFVHRYDDAS